MILAWALPASAQIPPAPLTVTLAEPQSSPQPSALAAEADLPLLRRYVTGLADGMAPLPPFLGDTALNLHIRTFYFNRLNSNETQNEAWAFGGWLAYRSGWLANTLAIGAVGYTSQPLYAPEDHPGTFIDKPPQEPILVLGQAYLQLNYEEYALLTAYRQLVDEGYVNPNDNRMIPQTFEGVTVSGKLGAVGYNVGYISAMKPRQENHFTNMADIAGVTSNGKERGLVLTRLSSSELLPGLSVYGANYLVPDVFNTIFTSGEYRYPLARDLFLQGGMHYTDQRSVGGAFLGDFSTWNVELRALVGWQGLSADALFGATGDGAAIKSPYGTFPGYLSFQEKDFDRAREKAWGVDIKYDFNGGTLLPFRVPGLSAFVRYAEGSDAINPTTGTHLNRVREGDFDVTWNVPAVRGLSFRFRDAYVAESGERVTQAFRLILNYELPLL